MAIKPIDMQVNVAQMHEVAKTAQVRSEATVEQQHVLDKESIRKANLVASRLEENKKAERAITMREEKKEHSRGHLPAEGGGPEERRKKQEERGEIQDDKIGRIIDIKK
jgi:hypothetical protein